MPALEDTAERAQARIGKRLGGRWLVVSALACGGTGWVYAALDDMGRKAAVKVLHTSLLSHENAVTRFLREAKMSSAIGHDGVVQVLDQGTASDGVPFLAMEYLDGETLHDRAIRKGGKLPVIEVLWALDQVLQILAAAHEKGIIHRDVKPENIFLTRACEIKLLDFGLARLRQGISSETLTRTGAILGTLAFMAPEQGRGETEKIDVPADLWGVGATMFALLAGRPVHDEDDLRELMRAVMREPAPPIAQVAPEVPRPVAQLVDQALRFEARDRWTSAFTMSMALTIAYASMSDEAASSSRDGRIPRPHIMMPPARPAMSELPRK